MKNDLIKLLQNYDFRKEEIECIVESCEECLYDDGVKLMIARITNNKVYDRDTIINYSIELAGCNNQKIIIEKQ